MAVSTTDILVLTRYGRLGASSRQRFLLFEGALADSGFAPEVRPFFSDGYLADLYAGRAMRWLEIARCYARRVAVLLRRPPGEIMWLEKEALPWLPAWLDRLLLGGCTLVIDFDDGWHLRYQGHDAPCHARIMARKLERLARSADTVIVANQALMSWARNVGCARVELIPTTVDTSLYPLREEPDGPFTIGWIGTPRNATYLQLVLEPLQRLSQEGARLKVIGGNPATALPGVALEVVPWSEATEACALAACHVGIMPLAGSEWDQHKSGYKIIQYMAAGRAAVASPIGANLDILSEGETGLFAHGPDEWYATLARLRDDSEMRKRMGAAGRRRCEARFSRDVAAKQVAQVFEWARERATPHRCGGSA